MIEIDWIVREACTCDAPKRLLQNGTHTYTHSCEKQCIIYKWHGQWLGSHTVRRRIFNEFACFVLFRSEEFNERAKWVNNANNANGIAKRNSQQFCTDFNNKKGAVAAAAAAQQ